MPDCSVPYDAEMGLSLSFLRISPDAIIDAHRAGISRFLEQRGLRIVADEHGGAIVTQDDQRLTFDGHWADLRIDPLDQIGPVTGHLSYATVSPEECAFVYELCVAAGFLIINPPGAPLYVVPRRNHTPEDLPEHEDDDAAWVNSSAELAQALSGEADAFRAHRGGAVAQEAPPPPPGASL